MKLLYAEDEEAMAEAVVDILEFHKYTVDHAADGEAAYALARTNHYDGMILDIMMPKMSGTEVLKRLRAAGDNTPVLLLTAKTEVEDRIAGLDSGADDYLMKPFAMGELLARVRAMLRRRESYQPEDLKFADLSLSLSDFTLRRKGAEDIVLKRKEYQIMETFMSHPGMYFSADTLLANIWGADAEADTSTVWVYISNIRKHLKVLGTKVTLSSRRGIGYRLEE